MEKRLPLNVELLKGNGPPLIFLHGWKKSLEDLKPLGELLSSVSTPYLIDLPGFGRSPPPSSAWDVYEYAECIHTYIQERQLGVVDVIGHSFGGKIALCLAARYPQSIKKLVLMAPSALKPQHDFKSRVRLVALRFFGKSLKAFDRCFGSNYFQSSFVPRFGSKDYREAAELREILVKTVNLDLSEDALQVQAPTLLLWGDEDPHTPIESAYRLHEMIRKSQLKILPGKGHHLFEDVGAHLCAYKIRNFLSLREEEMNHV